MKKPKNVSTKSVFKINESFKKTSLGRLLNLVDSVPKSEFEIVFKDIHWEEHLDNSYKVAEISRESYEA